MVFTTRLAGGRGGRNGFETEVRALVSAGAIDGLSAPTRLDRTAMIGRGIWRAFAVTTSTRLTHTEGSAGALSEANGMPSTPRSEAARALTFGE
jgi:hypothetical protein